MTIVFENASLLPSMWETSDGGMLIRAFNPGLLRDGSGWLMAYRIVCEPALVRRIAVCRLDRKFNVVEGSQLPLSDWFRFRNPSDLPPQATMWFADPRLYRLQDRTFVYWNSGWHDPRNYQFLQELDAATLRPVGFPRELTLPGPRQKLEKNWTLFECGDLYAVYSVNPHRVLTFSLAGDGPIEFADAAPPIPNPGGYAQRHGGLRGGAPPQRQGDHFYSFCHSIENGTDGYRYVPSAYRFAATPPFPPTDLPHLPITIEVPRNARRAWPKLNPAVSEVIYPAGAAYDDGKWVVSFGIDDERCAIASFDSAEVARTFAPVG